MTQSYLDRVKAAINEIKKANSEPELYKNVVEVLLSEFDFERAAVRRVDWERGILSLICHLGFTRRMPAFEIPLSNDPGGAVNIAVTSGRAALAHPDGGAKVDLDFAVRNPEMGADSFAVVPMKSNEVVRALLFIDRGKNGGPLSGEDLELLELMAEMTSALLEGLVDYDKLDTALIRDDLTLLFNRNYVIRRLGEEFERSKRYGQPLSICMFDIDDFKRINDSYGHMFGDEVLRNLSRVASDIVRSLDVLARYGGEEFMVLFPHTVLESAVIAVERLRHALEDTEFNIGGIKVNVTATFGVSSYPPVKTCRADELLHYADMALYEGKRKYNKNCSVIYTGKGFRRVEVEGAAVSELP